MTSACFDSDVLIDFFQGHEQARDEIARYDDPVISIVSWVEVMTGAERGGIGQSVRAALGDFRVILVDWPIAEAATALRASRRLRSADALIWGTARSIGIPLVTRNTRDFPEDDPGIRVPYRL